MSERDDERYRSELARVQANRHPLPAGRRRELAERYEGFDDERTLVHREVQGTNRVRILPRRDESDFFMDAPMRRSTQDLYELAPDRHGWRWGPLAGYVFGLLMLVAVMGLLVAAGVLDVSLPPAPWSTSR
jgi:hypothetical protein